MAKTRISYYIYAHKNVRTLGLVFIVAIYELKSNRSIKSIIQAGDKAYLPIFLRTSINFCDFLRIYKWCD